MSQVMRTLRKVPKETIIARRFLRVDSRGRAVFGIDRDVEARVVRTGEWLTVASGARTRIPLVVWVEGTAAFLPAEKDQIEVDGQKFVVAECRSPRRLFRTRTAIGHVRLACRLEG